MDERGHRCASALKTRRDIAGALSRIKQQMDPIADVETTVHLTREGNRKKGPTPTSVWFCPRHHPPEFGLSVEAFVSIGTQPTGKGDRGSLSRGGDNYSQASCVAEPQTERVRGRT